MSSGSSHRRRGPLVSALGYASWLSCLLLIAGCQGKSRLAEPTELGSDRDRNLTVSFEGAQSVSPRELEKELGRVLDDFEDSGFRAAYLDDAAYRLEAFLRERGFLSARSDASWFPTESGGHIEFSVEEGPQAELESFVIQGATVFGEDELRGLFQFPRGTGDSDSKTFYASGAFAEGRRALEDRYAALGYPDLDLRGPTLFREPNGTSVRVVLDLVEGVAQRLAAVEFDVEGPVTAEQLEGSVDEWIGEPYTARLATRVRGRLLETYANLGFPNATVVAPRRLDPETGAVTLRVRVVPGPRVRLGTIHTPEDVRSRRSFVLERLGLTPGDLYDEAALRRGFARLYRTGLYRTVEVDLGQDPPADLSDPAAAYPSDIEDTVVRDLFVQLDEAPSSELFVEPGYGAFERSRLRAGFRQRNLFGTGRGLRLEGLIAERAAGIELGLSDPRLFGTDILGDASISYELRDRPSFTREESSFELSGTFARTRTFQFAVEYAIRNSQVFDVEVDPAFDETLAAALEGVDVASLTIAPSYDSRDRLFTPSSGVQARFSLEWANGGLGSEIDFLRPTFSLSAFWPLDAVSPGAVLGATFQGGAIVPLGGADEIPITERFFNGGAHTVRAFEQDELGPQDGQGQFLGGRALQIASIEWRQPLIGRLHGALFYDLGNVLVDHRDAFDLSGIRGGPGAGLRYLLPVGPIRLDVGVNPDTNAGESALVIHFSVGMAF